ncbi:MAG: hypothetical protein R6V75_10535 [Bacteroidales bacterium]
MKIILSAYGLITAVVVIILIALIVRRVRMRKKENFEKRTN